MNIMINDMMSSLLYFLLVGLHVLTIPRDVSCDGSFIDKHEKSWDSMFRVKRQGQKRGYTSVERQKLVELHNHYRSQEPASDMRRIEWDVGIEKVAQKWADNCVWTHSPQGRGQLEAFNYIGENLYAKTVLPSTEDVIESWAGEINDYDYNSGGCKGVCGHYTQVVWARTYAVGCGIRYCPRITNLDSWNNGGYIVVCNYGPGGNIRGRKPYTRGESCSKCPEEAPYCIQNLCSKTKIIISASTTNPVKCYAPLIVAMVTLFTFLT